jgi:hypothetical protein
LACSFGFEAVHSGLLSKPCAEWNVDDLKRVALEVHERLVAEAHSQGIAVQGFHCTLLLAIVGCCRSAFLQIGDGAIVVGDTSEFVAVFWPQAGEFAGMTNFITMADYAERIECRVLDDVFESAAVFTDGLERLVLDMKNQSVHQLFFRQMFGHMRSVPSDCGLQQALESFLDADSVNTRTDDDKTLVLAVRRSVLCDAQSS